jgi:hypothetical protein
MDFDLGDVGEFVNENPQIPLAAGLVAGQAIRRNADQARRNAEQARKDAADLKKSLAAIHKQNDEARRLEESENNSREQVFQIKAQLDKLIAQSKKTPKLLLSLRLLSHNFNSLAATTATFRAISDKELVNSTKNRIHEALEDCRANISSEALASIDVLMQRSIFSERATSMLLKEDLCDEQRSDVDEAEVLYKHWESRAKQPEVSEEQSAKITNARNTAMLGVLGLINALVIYVVDSAKGLLTPGGLISIVLISIGIIYGRSYVAMLRKISARRVRCSAKAQESLKKKQEMEGRLKRWEQELERLRANVLLYGRSELLSRELREFLADSANPTALRWEKLKTFKSSVESLREKLRIPEDLLLKVASIESSRFINR